MPPDEPPHRLAPKSGINAPVHRLRPLLKEQPCPCERGELVLPGRLCRECKRDEYLTHKRDSMNRLRLARRRHDDHDDDRDGATVTPTRPLARHPRAFNLADYLEVESDRHAYEARLRRIWTRCFTARRFLKGFHQPCYTPTFHAGVRKALAHDPRLRRVPPFTGERRYERAPGATFDLATTNLLTDRGHVRRDDAPEGGARA